MRKFSIKDATFFVSEETVKEFGSLLGPHYVNRILETRLDNSFANRSELKTYIDLFSKLNPSIGKYGVLDAHGNTDGREWVYGDKGSDYRVQDWVNSNDGKFSTLLLYSCNPGQHTPTSNRSLILFPNDTFNVADLRAGKTSFSLVHPKLGEIDSYVVEYEIESLRRKLAGLESKLLQKA